MGNDMGEKEEGVKDTEQIKERQGRQKKRMVKGRGKSAEWVIIRKMIKEKNNGRGGMNIQQKLFRPGTKPALALKSRERITR